MHQRKYTLNLISDLGLAGAKPEGSPLELNLNLTFADLNNITVVLTKDLLVDYYI